VIFCVAIGGVGIAAAVLYERDRKTLATALLFGALFAFIVGLIVLAQEL
jgi:hypothetical protein